MLSNYKVEQVTQSLYPCIHSYYDICPESPSGKALLYTQWKSQEVPGLACTGRLNLKNGTSKLFNDWEYSIGHSGRFPCWLSDELFSSQQGVVEKSEGYCIQSIDGERRETRSGCLRQFHTKQQKAVELNFSSINNPKGQRNSIQVRDFRGNKVGQFEIHQLNSLLPECESDELRDTLCFQNAKWSPNGRQFFVVLTNERYKRENKEFTKSIPKIKMLLLFDEDAKFIKNLGSFGHHPGWLWTSPSAIFYEKNSDGLQDLIQVDTISGIRKNLIKNFPGVHPITTYDDQYIITDVFESPEPGSAQIIKTPFKGGEVEVLATFNHLFKNKQKGMHPHPVLSRDGKSVYFNAADTGVCQVYRLWLD